MKTYSPANLAALQAGRLVERDFVRFIVRDRDTGDAVEDCYWSDIYQSDFDVVDPDTGGTLTLSFSAGGNLISIADIKFTSTLTIETIDITLAQASDRVTTLIHAYDCKQGRVQVWSGLFDPATHVMVDPAEILFDGTIDQAPITTPKEGDASGNVTLTCTANTQELTRTNPDTRSDASQRLRSATDDFFADVAVVPQWVQFWGSASSTVPTAADQLAAGFKSLASSGQLT